jgi:hypothetical protein
MLGAGSRVESIFNEMKENIYIENVNVTVLKLSSFSVPKSVLGFCWFYFEQGMALGQWKRTQRYNCIFMSLCLF